MLIDIVQLEDSIEISYINTSGKIEISKYPVDKYNWVIADNKSASTDYINWDGRRVKKQKAKRLNKFSIYEFLWRLPKSEQEKLFALNYPKIVSIDIECLTPDEGVEDFQEWVNEPTTQITTISITLDTLDTIILGTKDLDKNNLKKIESDVADLLNSAGFQQKPKISYTKFESEYDMLYTFFEKFVPKFSLQIGWNYTGFDWSYMVNRCIKYLNIDPSICSPSKELHKNLIPHHVGIVDYAEIFDKWDRSIEVKENNTLDFIAKEVLGISKVNYNGSLNELYEKDYQRYVFYNAVDSILVMLIDKKRMVVSLMCTLSQICKISIYGAIKPTVVGEALLSYEYFKQNKVVAYEYIKNVKVPYEGAYVKKPIPGLFNWVVCFDFASLYPTIMRMFNVSPESLIMQLSRPENCNKFVDIVKNESLQEKIKETRLDLTKIVSVTGAVYNKKESALCRILTEKYNQRVDYKAKYKDYLKKIESLELTIKDLKINKIKI